MRSNQSLAQEHNTPSRTLEPVTAHAKFLMAGPERFWVKGISYGAFRPDSGGREYFDRAQLRRDFAAMAEAGFNTVRIPHTVPPPHLLDIAEQHGLRVMVGLSAEQYVGYLIDTGKRPNLPQLIRERARTVAGHPALFCYGLGNEIPASMARWIGRKRLEQYLRELYFTVKETDPDRLVTYVNYPTTEYLHLPFLDMLSFNVYLEQRDKLANYIARLQNLAGDRPLLMSEIGMDAVRNGIQKQAAALEWQIRTTFSEGCAGAIVFSWTDEWFRGGGDVDDWGFGLTDRHRTPKPALATVSRAFQDVPVPADRAQPRVSVVLCTYNGARTIAQSLDHLAGLNYANYEVIVVDDGSTDTTAEIVRRYPVRLIQTVNRGLSSARNTGWQAATGEIVAYIDDDAYPDAYWLDYLVVTLTEGKYAAVGGPNLAPQEDGWMAQCVARSAGGPTQVLLTDRTAEHIPGCNMAFRRAVLQRLGGFDTQFRIAGDDVDICWRVLEEGYQIGFSPAAVVWHHRRPSLRAFWKQQKNYGRSEALLHRKWPQKFNQAKHAMWMGRVYRGGMNLLPGLRPVIYHGVWGEAPYQSLQPRQAQAWQSLPMMPEWYLVNSALALLAILGIFWRPLLWMLPVLAASAGWPLWLGLQEVRGARFETGASPWRQRGSRAVILLLNIVQPLARLWGRLGNGLAPWAKRQRLGFLWPRRRETASFETRWIEPRHRLETAETLLLETGALVARGGDFDAWDLEVRTGLLGAARLLMAVEDQGSGTQYVRWASWPVLSRAAWSVVAILVVSGALAAAQSQTPVALVLVALGALLLVKMILSAGSALAAAALVCAAPAREGQRASAPAQASQAARTG